MKPCALVRFSIKTYKLVYRQVGSVGKLAAFVNSIYNNKVHWIMHAPERCFWFDSLHVYILHGPIQRFGELLKSFYFIER